MAVARRAQKATGNLNVLKKCMVFVLVMGRCRSLGRVWEDLVDRVREDWYVDDEMTDESRPIVACLESEPIGSF